MDYETRRLGARDVESGMDLVWRVFEEFEAPEYSEEGIAEFKAFITPANIRDWMEAGNMVLWGAYKGDCIVGLIALRPLAHISLLFVDKAHHRRGIARLLLADALAHVRASGGGTLTVNASPYGLEAYRHLGFAATDEEQVVNGLRFTPMQRPVHL